MLDRSAGLRHIGAGYSGLAAIDPTYAAHWNPAGIVYAEAHSAALSYDQQFDVSVLAGDGVYLTDNGLPIGLSFIQSEVTGIPETEDHGDTPVKTGTFADTYRMFGCTLGTYWGDVAVGATAKYLNRSLSTYGADGYGIDLGARYALNPQVGVGLVYRNVFSDILWSTGTSEALEKKLGLGLSVLDTLGDMPLLLNADYDIAISSIENFWALGGELWLMPKLLALRLGTNSHKDITFGLGLRYQDFFTDLAIVFKDEKTNLESYALFSAGIFFTPNNTQRINN